MKELLHRFENIEGVRGVVIHDGTKVLESLLPQDISYETSNAMGSFLNEMIMGVNFAGVTLKKITFYFNNLVIVSIPGKDRISLNIICERNINIPRLDVSLNAVVSELSKQFTGKEEKKGVNVDDILHGPLAFHLERIKEIYSEFVGPVAPIIMRECLENWVLQGSIGRSSLTGLITMLGEEVEPSERNDFISKAKGIIIKMI